VVAHAVETGGGMESQLGLLIRGLLDEGHRVTLIARESGLPSHARLEWVRVPGIARPFSLAYPLFFLLGSLALRRRGRGIVHTTGAIVFNHADVSTVHFCHAAFERGSGGLSRAARAGLLYRLNARVGSWMSVAAERYCYRRSVTDRLVGVSVGVARELRQAFPPMAERVEVIPNGIDRDRFAPDRQARTTTRAELGISDRGLVALFVGSEWERKGLALAVEAVVAAPEWELVVVGSGDRSRFETLAREHGVAERVHLVGPHADPRRFFAAADAFVLPTAYETFSMVSFEAAAAGLPLLVTRVSGVEDLLVDGENGWFIERAVPSITKRLAALSESGSRRSRLGANAREATRPYSPGAVVRGYVDLYRHIAIAS